MARWAKKKAGCLAEDLHLLPLQRAGELQAISNNNKKVKILIERFSP